MDSWVYPLMDRLAAMGYIDSAFEGNGRGLDRNAPDWSREGLLPRGAPGGH